MCNGHSHSHTLTRAHTRTYQSGLSDVFRGFETSPNFSSYFSSPSFSSLSQSSTQIHPSTTRITTSRASNDHDDDEDQVFSLKIVLLLALFRDDRGRCWRFSSGGVTSTTTSCDGTPRFRMRGKKERHVIRPEGLR